MPRRHTLAFYSQGERESKKASLHGSCVQRMAELRASPAHANVAFTSSTLDFPRLKRPVPAKVQHSRELHLTAALSRQNLRAFTHSVMPRKHRDALSLVLGKGYGLVLHVCAGVGAGKKRAPAPT